MKPKILVFDHGMFTSFALKLSQWFDVFYYTPWDSQAFPSPNNSFIGDGFSEMVRVKDFWATVPQMDYFFFADIYSGGLQEHLRGLGKKVFGSGRGDSLEILRWKMRKLMGLAGMPVNKAERVIGTKALREYLKSHNDVYVKVSAYRGLCETFHSDTYELTEPLLDEIENDLGGLKYVLPFIIEQKIDAVVETGYDGYSIDGKYPETSLFGVEVKDCGYLGTIVKTENMPNEVTFVNNKLSPMLAELQYRMAISTEIRVCKDGIPYLIDLTCRLPSPPSQVMSEIYGNWDEIIIEGSQGKLVDAAPLAKFGVSATICASFAEDHWTPIYIKESCRQFVKLHNHCNIEGVDYIIPANVHMAEVGAVVGVGDTLEEAAAHCRKMAEGVGGYSVKVKLDSLSEGLAEIKKMQDYGIKFCDDKLPKEL